MVRVIKIKKKSGWNNTWEQQDFDTNKDLHHSNGITYHKTIIKETDVGICNIGTNFVILYVCFSLMNHEHHLLFETIAVKVHEDMRTKNN